MKLLIVDEHQKQSYRVDSDNGDKKVGWYPNVSWVKECDENDDDILRENDSVHEKQLRVACT